MSIIVAYIGLIGGVLLSICAIPLAVTALRRGTARDIGWLFLAFWGIGEICMLTYGIYHAAPGIVLNTGVNTAAAVIILGVKIRDARNRPENR